MSRVFKKFTVFALFIFGIFFYAVVKNIGVPEPALNKESPRNLNGVSHQEIIAHRISNLENEIAAQKLYSNILLGKIRTKYSSSPEKKKKQKEEESQINNNEVLSTKVDELKNKGKEKLLALQKELQQEAHAGEVRSDIGDLNDEKDNIKGGQNRLDNNAIDNHLKDPEDLINGEVIDEHPPSNKKDKMTGTGYHYSDEDAVIAVLVFVCDRPTIKRSLDKLLKYRPSAKKFPIIVSQDCGSHAATTSVIKSYGDQIFHINQPDLSEINVPPKEKKMKGYFKIARHYGWALNYTFNVLNHENVLIVEDDLDVAPDFFEYFAATLPIMRKDPSIWCVSAWNDNGKPNRINETAYDLLHRTDFFPGLGWMMSKTLWRELMVKWPRGYWDDWMREPAQRRDRVCIRPEISRTSTFGKEGVSHGTYYMNHLRFIKLNEHFVPFTSHDLSYLTKDNFDVEFVRRVYSSHLVNSVTELIAVTSETPSPTPTEYRLVYRTKVDFRTLAKKLELMEDFKAGVPRTAYRGVVSFMLNGHRCYLAPGANWESYQPF